MQVMMRKCTASGGSSDPDDSLGDEIRPSRAPDPRSGRPVLAWSRFATTPQPGGPGFPRFGRLSRSTSLWSLKDKEHLLVRRQGPQIISDHRLEQIGCDAHRFHCRQQPFLRVLSVLFRGFDVIVRQLGPERGYPRPQIGNARRNLPERGVVALQLRRP